MLLYTAGLSAVAIAGAAVFVPLVNLFFYPELWADLLLIGVIVTALVAPPISFWTAVRIVEMNRQRIELSRQKAELIEANAAAARASADKDRFVAVMSHEIRTPLSGVLGLAQMLADRPQNAENKHLAKTLLDSGNSLMALLNDLLDLSRVEAGKMQITPVEASISAEVKRVAMLFRQTAAEKGLTLTTHVAPDVPERLIFDPVRVRQCLGNLLSNAIKFTHRGSVSVSVKLAGVERIEIIVADTGIGISAEDCTTVFDAFSQIGGGGVVAQGGTGLGLAICRHLSHQMGGEITLHSEPGKGSTFTLTISADIARQDLAAQDLQQTADEWLNCADVLVVDDVATNRLVLRALLQDCGAKVRLADGGAEALAQFLERTPDIVLLDLLMPGMDGFETCRALRVIDDGAVPIIALSAHISEGDGQRCRDAGMDGSLTKPLNVQDLLSELSRLRAGNGRRHSAPAA